MSVERAQTAPASRQSRILHGDNLPLLQSMPAESVRLIYIDPPFNTGRTQTRRRLKTVAAAADGGDRTGFGGKRYHSEVIEEQAYADSYEDYTGFLAPRLREAHRVLTADGSLFFHIDWREAARCRLLLEEIFGGRAHCINEIIWAYDYGARSASKWSTKHDNIYWFAKNPKAYIFNHDAVERIPYMAASLVGDEKAARGKTPTDVWWHTIVPTNSAERTSYPSQKPIDLLRWIIAVHSNLGDTVLDFFAGSGTCGAAAQALGRKYIMIDANEEAVQIAERRVSAPADSAPLSALEQRIDAELLKQKTKYRSDRAAWFGSEHAWIIPLAPASKGKLGRALAAAVLQGMLVDVRVHAKGTHLTVNDKKLSVKFSLLWETGQYVFEQIKPRADGYCLLGISPDSIHFWLLPASEYGRFDAQHSDNSRWVGVNPSRLNSDKTAGKSAGKISWPDYGGNLSQLKPSHFQWLTA